MRADLPGILLRIAHYHEGTRKNFQVFGVSTDLPHAALDVGIERSTFLQRARSDENHFSRFGG